MDNEKIADEYREQFDAIRRTFEDVKGRVIALEKNEDVVTKEALDKANDAITKQLDSLQAKMDAEEKEREGLEERINKKGLSADSAKLEEKASRLNASIKAVAKRDANFGVEEVKHYEAAFKKMLRNPKNPGFTPEEEKAFRVGSESDGGFAVAPDMSGEMVRFVHETSAMRQVANVRQIATDALEGLYQIGDYGANWVGETTSRSETATPDLGTYRNEAFELQAWPEVSMKALDDMPNMEAQLARDAAERFSRKEEAAFFNGTGVNQPRGILTYTAGTPASTSVTAYEKIQQLGTGVSGDFEAAATAGDVLIDAIGALKAPFINGNTRWLMNRSTFAAVRKLRKTDGELLWEQSLQQGNPFSLLGYPLQNAEDMPDIAANSLSIAVGDFQQGYQIVDRVGVSLLVDPYTSTTGFVKFKFRKRVGGRVTNFEAIKLVKFG